MRFVGGEEIISFDFKTAELVPVGANHVSASLFAFTGESTDGASRARHLADLDCVLFVADSRPDRLGDNIASLKAVTAMRVLHEVPVIVLYNKRDLPDATPVGELQAALNRAGATHIEASAVTGEGCAAVLGALVSAAFAAD